MQAEALVCKCTDCAPISIPVIYTVGSSLSMSLVSISLLFILIIVFYLLSIRFCIALIARQSPIGYLAFVQLIVQVRKCGANYCLLFALIFSLYLLSVSICLVMHSFASSCYKTTCIQNGSVCVCVFVI